MADEPLFPDLTAAGEQTAEPSNTDGAPTDPATPAVTDSTATPADAASTGAVPDLFGEPAAAASTPASADSTVVNAVVNQNDPNKDQILGPKPQTASGLDVRSKQFNLGGLLFKLAIVLAILTYGFFYTQLSPRSNTHLPLMYLDKSQNPHNKAPTQK